MPRKAKDNIKKEENINEITPKTNTKSSKVKVSKNLETKAIEEKVSKTKNSKIKSASTATKKISVKNDEAKKSTKKSSVKRDETKKSTKKTSAKKDESKKSAKPVSSKANSSKSSKATSKTTSNSKSTKKKTSETLSVNKKISKKSISKKKLIKGRKSINLYTTQKKLPISVEYYDLPYRYNRTVIKALAQNPNTLFVYWEISDEDRQEFINMYGENFFNITKPVLIIHNLTDKYSYELDINDFANNWYIHVNNAKSQYVIELCRRPIEYTQEIPVDYLFITSSNVIEAPNDHIIFFKENDTIKFRNMRTNKYTQRVVKPFLKHIYGIYNNLNFSEDLDRFDFNNPSSQNPTSNVL